MRDVLNKVCVAFVALGIVSAACLILGDTIMMACVDYSKARYSQGDMVQLRVGVPGQVTAVIGANTYMPWDKRPAFDYQVRYDSDAGVKSGRFEDWEIK